MSLEPRGRVFVALTDCIFALLHRRQVCGGNGSSNALDRRNGPNAPATKKNRQCRCGIGLQPWRWMHSDTAGTKGHGHGSKREAPPI